MTIPLDSQSRPPIRLLATDLDGTLIGNDEQHADFQAFRAILSNMRDHHETRWCLITGRHIAALQGVLGHFMMHCLVPDFIVVEDARIFRFNRRGKLVPFFWWNCHVDFMRLFLRWRSRRMLRDWQMTLQSMFCGARDRSRAGTDIWLHFNTLDDAVAAEAKLHELADSYRQFFVLRWGTEVCLAPAIGTKGEALGRICRYLNFPQSHVFAVGDGANDISMLCGEAGIRSACVGNASEQVISTVVNAGGYVCVRHGLAGVMEALQKQLGGLLMDDSVS